MDPDQKRAALAGIRIIDLTQGPAGGLVTMMLADFGASVLRINRPGPGCALEKLPATPMWHRGKQAIVSDLNDPDELEQLHRLCAGADVLVCNWRTQALAKKSLTGKELIEQHPHLIFCHITGFGDEGPLANVPAYEHSVAALTGRMQLFQGLVDRQGPVFSALQVGTHACAQSATAGILASLHARAQSGTGRTIHTSLLQGFMAYEQGAMLGKQFAEANPDSVPGAPPVPAEPPMPSLYYHPAQARDGRWMQFGNLLPHLFDNFLVATDLIDIVADPDFNPVQLLLPDKKQEAFRERMLARIASRSSSEWMQDLIANGQVVAGTYQTTQEALVDPDIVANGHALKRSDNSVQLGPIARLSETPAAPGGEVIDDAKASKSWLHLWTSTPRPAPSPAPKTSDFDLPLKGIKVLEIATIIAAPFGASLLADLGAEVTKVEQVGGDPYRGMLAGVGSSRVNAGKRSASINLKSAEGQEIVQALARETDILIHNYRPGVPERLGFGYDQLKAINPDIIYLQSNGYGPDGPGAQRPSTHPIPGAALGGVLHQLGHRVPETLQSIDDIKLWTRRLMRANEVNPDPNTALVVTTSALMGLVARDLNGVGQRVLVDMFGANAYANHDDFLSYPGKPERMQPDKELRGLSPTYKLYRCSDGHWVFLAMTQSAEFDRFMNALKTHSSATKRLLTREDLTEGGDALAIKLDRLFNEDTAAGWQALFVAHQISCVQADAYLPHDYWLTADQAQAMQLTTPAQHPAWGGYNRHSAMVKCSNQQPQLSAAPLAGQHNRELLLECGFDDADVDRLAESGTLWSG